MGLVTEYPAWLILFCILAGIAYSLALYFKADTFEMPRWLHRMLAAFRFITVFLISFLLLSPLIKRITTSVEKPVIIVAFDNSSSMKLTPDSLFFKNEMKERVDDLARQLGKKYEVRSYTFGDQTRSGLETSLEDNMTNIAGLFQDLESRYANRNVGALIMISDGIYNEGINPVYAAEKLPWPVYTVAAGDTTKKHDILIRKSVYNRTAYKGDKFPVEVYLEANGFAGQSARMTIQKGKDIVAERIIGITGNAFSRNIGFMLDANSPGMQHYTILVNPLDGEFTPSNNRSDIFIEVIETRQKIAMLFEAPHPDVGAMRTALEKSDRYELVVSDVDDFASNPESFDLLILYQLPSQSAKGSIDKFVNAQTSLLYVLGSTSDLNSFNKLNAGLVINASRSNFSEASPILNASFPLFVVDKETGSLIGNVPPLVAPFGTYQSNPLSEILFYQGIGTTPTRFPLIMFLSGPERKTGIIAGENLWRWRLYDYVTNGNHNTFDQLFGKIVQYLSVKEDKSFFRITGESRYSENDPVTYDAEVFNDSYERISTPDVSLIIKDLNGKEYPYLFGKSGSGYTLNAGTFGTGEYTWKASVNNGTRKLERYGSFVVAPLLFESLNTTADHNLLDRMAKLHDGAMVYPKDFGQLATMISSRPDVSSISHGRKVYDSLVGNLYLFLLLLALLTVEWVIRKRFGI